VQWRVYVGCSSRFLKPWTRRWINHRNLWHKASATPDQRLPSQPQGITAPWLVPNYTVWRHRHVCEQLAQGCYLYLVETAKCRTRDLLSCESNDLSTTQPGQPSLSHMQDAKQVVKFQRAVAKTCGQTNNRQTKKNTISSQFATCLPGPE